MGSGNQLAFLFFFNTVCVSMPWSGEKLHCGESPYLTEPSLEILPLIYPKAYPCVTVDPPN